MFTINKKEMKKFIENGYVDLTMLNAALLDKAVMAQFYPTQKNWAILNYTRQTEYSRNWNVVTIGCRGLIVDMKTGEIISRGFDKFFNYGEMPTLVEYGFVEPLPTGPCYRLEKMDGYYGISYFLNGKMTIASRGSFCSEMAEKANDILLNYPQFVKNANPEYSYVFEIIYDNKIVINYNVEKLVLLACIETKTGKNIDIYHLSNIDEMEVVKNYGNETVVSFDDLQKHNTPDKEGYVLLYPTGQRVKIKFAEYLRLHKILTQITTYDIWESLMFKKDIMDIIVDMPDEFMDTVKETILELETTFSKNVAEIDAIYTNVMSVLENPTKKEFATCVLANVKDRWKTKCVFDKHAGINFDEIIWLNIKPTFKKL